MMMYDHPIPIIRCAALHPNQGYGNREMIFWRVNRSAEGPAEEHISDSLHFTKLASLHQVLISNGTIYRTFPPVPVSYRTRHWHNAKASSSFRILKSRGPPKSCRSKKASVIQSEMLPSLPVTARPNETRRTHYTTPVRCDYAGQRGIPKNLEYILGGCLAARGCTCAVRWTAQATAPTCQPPFVSSIHHQLSLSLLHNSSCPLNPRHPPPILTSRPYSTPLSNLTIVKPRRT